MRKKNVTEEELHQHLDGELPPSRVRDVEAHLLADPDSASRVAAYRQQKSALHARFDGALGEIVPERLLAAAGPDNRRSLGLVLKLAAAVLLLAASWSAGWAMRGGEGVALAQQAALAHAGLTAAFVLGVQPGAAHGPNGEMGGEVPTVAGPFALTDHSGNPASNEDFLGQYMIVIFGYTVCPDFCPLELQNAAAVLDALGPAGGKVQPLFITIDPERDTPETLAEYVRHFHPKIIGLTGSMDAIHVAADGFGMWFEKTAVLTTPDGLIYFVSHLALNYVVGPDGAIIMAFPSGTGPEEISAAILEHMKTGGAEAGAI